MIGRTTPPERTQTGNGFPLKTVSFHRRRVAVSHRDRQSVCTTETAVSAGGHGGDVSLTQLTATDRTTRPTPAARSAVWVRHARPSDAAALPAVHAAAAHEGGRQVYDSAVVSVWARERDPESYPVAESGVTFVVAEHTDEEAVVGFAELRPNGGSFQRVPPGYGEVRAVYVHPDYADCGVGSRLLRRLERSARRHDLPGVGLLSSANAAGFYERLGYDRLGEFDHEFTTGVTAPVVEFARRLSATASPHSSASPRS